MKLLTLSLLFPFIIFIILYDYDLLFLSTSKYNNSNNNPDIVVIGGVLLDFLAEPISDHLLLETSNPGIIYKSWGGVSRNIAKSISIGLQSLDKSANKDSIFYISVLGNDLISDSFYLEHDTLFNTLGVNKVKGNTGIYLAISKGLKYKNDLHTAIAEVDIINLLTPEYISQYKDIIIQSKLVTIDANISIESLTYIVKLCRENKINIWYEPSSIPKSIKILQSTRYLSSITYISPNRKELEYMAQWIINNNKSISLHSFTSDTNFYIKEKQDIYILLQTGIKYIITTLGPNGTLLGYCEKENDISTIQYIHFNAPPADVIQVNGAGDAMAGCCISSLVLNNNIEKSIEIGHLCAKLQLESKPLSLLDTLI